MMVLNMITDIFMDYLFIVQLAWNIMEFYLNIGLKQTTYTVNIMFKNL